MTIKTATFICVSELFRGRDAGREAFGAFDGHQVTWGTNDHSLIDVDCMIDAIDRVLDYTDGVKAQRDLEHIRELLESQPRDVYVDLES